MWRHLEAYGRYMGGMWRHLNTSGGIRKHLWRLLEASGSIWRASGNIWEHLGGISRHLGASGRQLRGNEAFGDIWKLFFRRMCQNCYVSQCFSSRPSVSCRRLSPNNAIYSNFARSRATGHDRKYSTHSRRTSDRTSTV